MKQRDDGEIAARSFDEYKASTDRLIAVFGGNRVVAELRPGDFTTLYRKLKAQYGPVRLGNEIQRVKTVFNRAFKQEWIDRIPNFGDDFKKPGGRELRLHRIDVGRRTFTTDELRRLIEGANVPLRAVILLGINCAYGCSDIGHLPTLKVDLDKGWIDYARDRKTGIGRRAWIWPETIAAIRAYQAERPDPGPGVDPGLLFITRWGRPWANGGTSNAVTAEFGKLARKVESYRRRSEA